MARAATATRRSSGPDSAVAIGVPPVEALQGPIAILLRGDSAVLTRQGHATCYRPGSHRRGPACRAYRALTLAAHRHALAELLARDLPVAIAVERAKACP